MRTFAEAPPATGSDDDLRAFTVPETAAMIGISEVYLRMMLARAEIRSVRAGRRILVPASAIREFLSPAVANRTDQSGAPRT